MSWKSRCCRDLSRPSKGPSPFDRVIALGWYDGPTEGPVRCGACGQVYRFDLLDSVDADREIRLYSVAPVPADTMDRLVDVLSPFMTPSWPMWAPLRKFPSEDDRIAVERAVDELMSKAAAREFVIETAGLLDEIDDVKAAPTADAAPVTVSARAT
jgi:hypothetical protein